jgi:hypothetical protein
MARNRSSWLFVLVACVGCIAFSGSFAWGQPAPDREPAPAAASPPPAVAAGQTTAAEPLRTASDRPITIDNIRLNLRVDVAKKTVESKATLSFRCVRPTQTASLDAVDFEVKHVAAKLGQQSIHPARYTWDGKKLIVDLGARLHADEAGTLEVVYRIQEPKIRKRDSPLFALELAGQQGFADEAGRNLLVASPFRKQFLDRHLAVQLTTAGAPDAAEPAPGMQTCEDIA